MKSSKFRRFWGIEFLSSDLLEMTTTNYHSPLLSASAYHQTPSLLSLHGFKQVSAIVKGHNFRLSAKSNGVFQNTKPNIFCSMNMAAGQSGDPDKLKLGHFMNKARKLWENSPEPVKKFPWNRVLDSFIQLVLDLVLVVVKCLSIPLLAVSSVSEMSYCAHEKKLFLVLIPLLIGMAMADILRQTALELSPFLKEAEADVPWHLIAIAIFFTLLKFPGPYYPYWGRIFIPHLANGALFRTLWFAFLWYRKPTKND